MFSRTIFPSGVATGSIGRRALRGVVWMLAQNVVGRICSLASQIILAVILVPADFGVISIALTMTSIASVFSSIGLDNVILQRYRSLHVWTGSAFWISLGLAGLAAAIIIGVSPIVAGVYKAPDLVGLLTILAVSLPISAVATVPQIIMQARMRFAVIALYGTLEIIVSSAWTIGLAWMGFHAYSFVIPVPFLAVLKAAIWWHLAASKPNFRPQVRRWKYLVGNTAAMFTTRLLNSLVDQGDYLVLGLLASKDVVGVYYFGFRLAVQPVAVLAGSLSNVLFPALLQVTSDPIRQRVAVMNASTLLAFCMMPLGLFQAAVAGPVVNSLFGDKWAASIPVIQFLSVGLAFDAVSWIALALLNARREFGVFSRYVSIQTPIFFILVVIGAWMDEAVGVAGAVCLWYVVTQPILVCGAYGRIGIKPREVIAIYFYPAAYGVLAVGFGLAVSMLPLFAGHALMRISAIGLFSVPIYAALVWWLAPATWEQLRDRITLIGRT